MSRSRRRRLRNRSGPPRRDRSRSSAAATFKLTTIHRSSSIRKTLPLRSLIRLPGYTILPSVEHRSPSGCRARRSLAGEVVKRVRKVLQTRQLTNRRRNNTRKLVVRHIKLLQTLHVPDLHRQRALKIIETDVNHRQVLQKPDLRRQTAGEIVVQQNDLVESLRHLSDTPGNTTSEVVVSKHQNRDRGVSEILGDSEAEPVVV